MITTWFVRLLGEGHGDVHRDRRGPDAPLGLKHAMRRRLPRTGDHRRVGAAVEVARALVAESQRLDPGLELPGVERPGDDVVGAGLEEARSAPRRRPTGSDAQDRDGRQGRRLADRPRRRRRSRRGGRRDRSTMTSRVAAGAASDVRIAGSASGCGPRFAALSRADSSPESEIEEETAGGHDAVPRVQVAIAWAPGRRRRPAEDASATTC